MYLSRLKSGDRIELGFLALLTSLNRIANYVTPHSHESAP